MVSVGDDKSTGGQAGRFDGWRVVVTGGSRGLGEQVVRLLLSEGARVVTCGRTADHLDALRAVVEPVERERLVTRVLDVVEPGAVESFIAEAVDELGGLDGAVASAGGARGGGIGEATHQDWSMTWEMNAGHAARLIGATAPHLRAVGGGSVVVISSISGSRPGPQAQYGAAKAAQIHMVASLARELGPDGIRVNAVSPGSMLIRGKRWDRMREKDPAAFDRFRDEFPGRELVDPREVADVIAFLLSAESRGVTGANIPVDRGQNAPTPDGY